MVESCRGMTLLVLLCLCVLRGFAEAEEPVMSGGFAPEGAYVGCVWPAPGRPAGLATWGSHLGRDDHTGEFVSAPFILEGPFSVYLAGYPGSQNNRLEIRVEGEHTVFPIVLHLQPGERWERITIQPPAHWRGRTVRLHAVDNATEPRGWLALSSPLPPQPSRRYEIIWRALGYLVLAVAFLTLPGIAWLSYQAAQGKVGDLPGAAVQVFVPGLALCGLAYWLFLVHPWLGRLTAIVMTVAPLSMVYRYGRAAWRTSGLLHALSGLILVWLLLTVGVLLTGFAVGAWEKPYATAAIRYSHTLPGDNSIPGDFANGLLKGRVLRPLHSDWLSSDRPPLQAAAAALVAAIARPLMGTSSALGHQVVGTLLQCLWLPAIATLCLAAGAPACAAGLLALVLACSPVVIIHSFYVWPKLLAAALIVLALVPLCSVRPLRDLDTLTWASASACCALALLAHGGTAFILPAMAVGVIVRLGRQAWPWRKVATAVCVAVILLSAWKGYQKFVDPPGHRLEKLHLAGISAPDDTRDLWPALRDAYAGLSFAEWWQRRLTNVRVILGPAETPKIWWAAIRSATGFWPADGDALHTMSMLCFFNLLPAIGFPVFGAFACVDFRHRTRVQPLFRCAVSWLLLSIATLLVWVILMFDPASCLVHQGTLALPLLVTAMGLLGAWAVHPILALSIAIPSVLSGWLLYGWSRAPALIEDGVIRPHEAPWSWGLGWLCVVVAVAGSALYCRALGQCRKSIHC